MYKKWKITTLSLMDKKKFASKLCNTNWCLGRKIKALLVNKMNMKSLENWARLDEKVDCYTYCTLDLCYEKEDKTTHIHPEEEFRNIISRKDWMHFVYNINHLWYFQLLLHASIEISMNWLFDVKKSFCQVPQPTNFSQLGIGEPD